MHLIEGRLEFLKQKYGEKIDEETFNLLVQADPTARNGQPGNYAQWIIINYLKAPDKSVYVEDLERLRGDLTVYNAHKPRLQPDQRDINKFTPQTLFAVIQPLMDKPKNKAEMVDMGTEKLYHDEHAIVLNVKTREAMVKLGRGTRWCVAADSDSGLSFWTSYKKDGNLILIHFKDGARYLMHDTDRTHAQFMDINDIPVRFEELLSHHPEPSKFKKFLSRFSVIRYHAVNSGLYHEFHDKPVEQDPSHQIRAMVAGSAKSPLEKVRALAHDPHPTVRASLAKARREPEILRILARDSSPEVRVAVVSNKNFPTGDAIATFQDDDSEEVRRALLNRINEYNDPEKGLVVKYLSDPNPSIRKAALMRTADAGVSIPLPMVAALSQDPSSDVRLLIARNTATPEQYLSKLASDKDYLIRQAIAKNPSTPVEALLSMVNDESYWVAKELSQRSEPAVLSALADDSRVKIRTLVAANRATPKSVLAKLQGEPSQQVRRGVLQNTGLEKSTLDPELWNKLISDSNPQARAKAASHPEAGPDQLAQLADDSEAVVRKAVALNSSTSTQTLSKLSTDQSPDVRLSVARNRGAAPQVLQTLFTAETARPHGDRYVFINIAANPNTPEEIVRQLSQTEDPWVLKGLASNPKTPVDVLRRLSNHTQALVSTTATQTLYNLQRG